MTEASWQMAKRTLGRICLLVLLAATLAGMPGPASPSDSLADLASIEEIRAEFNAANGRTRLILLLSPT